MEQKEQNIDLVGKQMHFILYDDTTNVRHFDVNILCKGLDGVNGIENSGLVVQKMGQNKKNRK